MSILAPITCPHLYPCITVSTWRQVGVEAVSVREVWAHGSPVENSEGYTEILFGFWTCYILSRFLRQSALFSFTSLLTQFLIFQHSPRSIFMTLITVLSLFPDSCNIISFFLVSNLCPSQNCFVSSHLQYHFFLSHLQFLSLTKSLAGRKLTNDVLVSWCNQRIDQVKDYTFVIKRVMNHLMVEIDEYASQ